MPEKKGKKSESKKKLEEPLDSPPEPSFEPLEDIDMEPPEEGDLGPEPSVEEIPDFDKEAVEGEHLGGHVDAPLEKPDFKQDLWEALEQAGITKQGFMKFVTRLGIGVLVLIFILFGWSRIFSDREVEVPVDIPDAEFVEAGIYSMVSAYIFGLEYAIVGDMDFFDVSPIGAFAELSSFETAFLMGDLDAERPERLVYYIELLRKMQNIYVTDVYALMDVSLDRRSAINRHIAELDGLIQEGVSAVEEIDRVLGELSVEFSEVAAQRDMYERAFFSDLEALYGMRVQDNLESFVEFAQKADRLKAKHNAYATIRKMIVNSVNALYPRHRAVEVNAEALIKGVRVYEVPGADIDAIIRLDL